MPILVYQLAGLAAALLVMFSMVTVSRVFRTSHWFYNFLFLFATLGSILSLQSLYAFKFLPIVVLLTLVTSATMSIVKKKVLPTGHIGSITSWAVWFMLVALACDLLFAAFPAYRYDQWNYHLTIGKIVTRFGALTEPVFDDHLYMSGVYEYFLTLGRAFSQNDIFNHAYADAFGLLVFCVGVYGSIDCWRVSRGMQNVPPYSLLVGAMLFGIEDHEAIIDAKPDTVLLGLAGAVLVLMYGLGKKRDLRGQSFWLGFLLMVGIAFKVSWVHFAAAATISGIILVVMRKLSVDMVQLLRGVFVGFVLAAPILVKNQYFFANTLHPAQLGHLFATPGWTADMTAYWYDVTRHVRSWTDYPGGLATVLYECLARFKWWLPILPLAWFFHPARKDHSHQMVSSGLTSIFLVGLTYVLLWPLAFRGEISPRFVMPVYAFVVLGITAGCNSIRRDGRNGIVVAFLFLPLITNSSLDVHLQKMARHWTLPKSDFFAKMGGPMRFEILAEAVNSHRQQVIGESASYDDATMIGDVAFSYFFNARRYNVNSYTWSDLRTRLLDGMCVRDILKTLRVRYVLQETKNTPLSSPWSDVALLGESIYEDAENGGRAWYLNDGAIEKVECPRSL